MKGLVPKRRFAGFTDPWEQRELGELARFSKGKGYSKNDLTEEGTPIILYGSLYTDYQTVINEINTFVIPKGNDTYSMGNEVIVPSSGETAEDIARASAVAVKGVLLGGDLNIIQLADGFNSVFFALTISGGERKIKLIEKAQGKSVVHLYNRDLQEIDVAYPNKEEQTQISNFFSQLDNLITLHQRKLDKLKATKSAYLSEMFPQYGELYPKRRFAGFTEPWERHKLGEVVEITMGQSPYSKNYTDNPADYILVQGNADIKNGKVLPRVWTKQVTKTAEKGDLILSVRAPVGDIGKTDYSVVLGRGVAGIKGNEFIFQLLTKMKESGYWRNLSTGSTFESINSNDVKDASILIPHIYEQEKIGTFFTNLDSLITFHQRKLEKLKSLKQAYLSEMFV